MSETKRASITRARITPLGERSTKDSGWDAEAFNGMSEAAKRFFCIDIIVAINNGTRVMTARAYPAKRTVVETAYAWAAELVTDPISGEQVPRMPMPPLPEWLGDRHEGFSHHSHQIKLNTPALAELLAAKMNGLTITQAERDSGLGDGTIRRALNEVHEYAKTSTVARFAEYLGVEAREFTL